VCLSLPNRTFQLPFEPSDARSWATAQSYAAGFKVRAVLRDQTAVCMRAIRSEDKSVSERHSDGCPGEACISDSSISSLTSHRTICAN
jgi:hypothetical protein